jgi:hypothetical protein
MGFICGGISVVTIGFGLIALMVANGTLKDAFFFI